MLAGSDFAGFVPPHWKIASNLHRHAGGLFAMSGEAEEGAAGGLNPLDALAQIAAAGPAKPFVPPPNACSVLTRESTSPAEQEGKAVAEIRCGGTLRWLNC